MSNQTNLFWDHYRIKDILECRISCIVVSYVKRDSFGLWVWVINVTTWWRVTAVWHMCYKHTISYVSICIDSIDLCHGKNNNRLYFSCTIEQLLNSIIVLRKWTIVELYIIFCKRVICMKSFDDKMKIVIIRQLAFDSLHSFLVLRKSRWKKKRRNYAIVLHNKSEENITEWFFESLYQSMCWLYWACL